MCLHGFWRHHMRCEVLLFLFSLIFSQTDIFFLNNLIFIDNCEQNVIDFICTSSENYSVELTNMGLLRFVHIFEGRNRHLFPECQTI